MVEWRLLVLLGYTSPSNASSPPFFKEHPMNTQQLELPLTVKLVYRPDGRTEFYYHNEAGDLLHSRVETPKMPDPDGNLHFFFVESDDMTPWGLWRKARNKLADKALAQRGKKLKGMPK